MNKSYKTVVIGAGIAGLTAARALQQAGEEVLVLEKSRGLGGRAATRRLHGHRLDHGAQYFTVRDERFQEQVNKWLDGGQIEVWAEGFHTLTDEGLEEPSDGHPRYVFPEGMNTFGKLLGEGTQVRTQTRVERLRKGERWGLELETGDTLEAERVLINVPAPQALALCREVGLSQKTTNALQEVKFAPCFTLMAGYPKRDVAWRGVTLKDEEVAKTLSWVSKDSSKRSETSAEEMTLVLNSSPNFSEQHLEDDREGIKEKMLSAATVLGDWVAQPLWTDMQRWLYSMVTKPYPEPYLKEDDSLLFCGDWCGGAKVETAYLSGLEVGQVLTS